MRSLEELAVLGSASIVAPAGYGKTELLARIGAKNKRTLVLTHTHAGVHALRDRLKKHNVPPHVVQVDTIAGWCTRYSQAFPATTSSLQGTPQTADEWDQLNRGTELAIQIPAIRDVVRSSYDQILIDEYQDCVPLQHKLAITLSTIIPTLIFGDPMQGIFEFAGANLSWKGDIHNDFPLACTLETPHRWVDTNPELGQWISETREKLIVGEQIDLHDRRIQFLESENAFDMSVLFDGLDNKAGSVAAIHCNKGMCNRIAKASNGGFQAIEENAGRALREFADLWDGAISNDERRNAFRYIFGECINAHESKPGEVDTDEVSVLLARIRNSAANLEDPTGALELLGMLRMIPRWKVFRGELFRDAERALHELVSSRASCMADAAEKVRQRTSIIGRRLPTRTISTPLLLKGLEFNHVILPSVEHYQRERHAGAKLFYVAISRATKSLTISAADRYVQFPVPNL